MNAWQSDGCAGGSKFALRYVALLVLMHICLIGWMHVDAFGCITWIESRGSPVAVSVKQEMRDLESKVDVVIGENGLDSDNDGGSDGDRGAEGDGDGDGNGRADGIADC